MTSFIKKYFIERKIRKNLERKRKLNIPLQSCFILFPENFVPEKNFLLQISKKTGIPPENIHTVSLVKNKDNNEHFSLRIQDVSITGKIKDHNMAKLISKPWDLLIDLTGLQDVFEQLISSEIKAGFKVGITDKFPEFYDLMILSDEKNKNNFPGELEKYLHSLQII